MIKICKRSHDGGKDSGVTGYWLIEWKSLFSIVLLRFGVGSREAFHEHAFDAYTWWIWGEVVEEYQDGSAPKTWKPSHKPKFTPKGCFHRIVAKVPSWAICFRGAWDNTWREHKNGETYTLTHGRKRID